MANDFSASIAVHFASLTDPRRRKVVYPLINILTIALCAVIAGADDFVTIAEWGRQKRTWLARILDLTNGIPSHDRFNAIFSATIGLSATTAHDVVLGALTGHMTRRATAPRDDRGGSLWSRTKENGESKPFDRLMREGVIPMTAFVG